MGPKLTRTSDLSLEIILAPDRLSWLALCGMLCLQNRTHLFLLGCAVEKGTFAWQGRGACCGAEMALPRWVLHATAWGNQPSSSSRAAASAWPLGCRASSPAKCLL